MSQTPFDTLDPFVWQGQRDRIVLSTLLGGRVISWQHAEAGELVKEPGVIDGGLLRVLFGEERYPGASYVTPHLGQMLRHDERGFQVRLRHFWSTPNAVARLLGWPEKVNPMYLDGLLLEKTVTFAAEQSALSVELAITNLSGQVRRLSPWLHNQWCGWAERAFVVIGGQTQPYRCADIWWSGHPPQPNQPMRLVHADKSGSLSAILGADSEWLAGMVSHIQDASGDDGPDGCMELRGKPITLAPGQRWRGTVFLALADGPESWKRWSTDAPIGLTHQIESASPLSWDSAALIPLLAHWALPEERERGFVAMSFLDKVPFTSASRFAASNAFSGFHLDSTGQRAQAAIVLFALRPIEPLRVELFGTEGWNLVGHHPQTISLKPQSLMRLLLEGPADLVDKERVEVRVTASNQHVLSFRVPPDATVEPRYSYQVKQVSAYLEERWRSEKGGFFGTTVPELERWQSAMRQRLRHWIDNAGTGPAPLAPRLMERQVGPHCVREKILIQTEPDLWLPMYLVRPKEVAGQKRPAILFPHGSGPGKLHFAPDETEADQDPATFDAWPSPYAFAHRLGCLVLIPDRRGWGEWSEANHGQRSQRAWHAGYNLVALDVWDHLRAVDYLLQRPDVDTSRVVSMGSSGGGWITMFVLGADERVAGGIVSSSVTTLPSLPDQYFFQTFADENAPLNPPPFLPLATATILCLASPRPLWIMDGKRDRGVLPTLPHTEEEAQAAFARWHAETNAGRQEVERVYRIVGAEQNHQSSWFEGGHLAGFTFNNIAVWLRRHFGIEHT